MRMIKFTIFLCSIVGFSLWIFTDFKQMGTAIIGMVLLVIFSFAFFNRSKRRKPKTLTKDILKIDHMSGEDFEKFLYQRLQDEGYRVELTPLSHDYGADLVIMKNRKCRTKIVVQAKRYQDNVGIRAVQEVAGAIPYYQAEKGVVITNSNYTKSAKELAKANQIMLINRQGLLRWLEGLQFDKLNLIEDKAHKGALICPRCGGTLVLRHSTYGAFYGCSQYPKCKYSKSSKDSAFRIS